MRALLLGVADSPEPGHLPVVNPRILLNQMRLRAIDVRLVLLEGLVECQCFQLRVGLLNLVSNITQVRLFPFKPVEHLQIKLFQKLLQIKLLLLHNYLLLAFFFSVLVDRGRDKVGLNVIFSVGGLLVVHSQEHPLERENYVNCRCHAAELESGRD